jgi:hypothetical protein
MLPLVVSCSVVPIDAKSTISGVSFVGYGSHCSAYPCPYFTAAAAIGLTVAVRVCCDPFFLLLAAALLPPTGVGGRVHALRFLFHVADRGLLWACAAGCGCIRGQVAQDIPGVFEGGWCQWRW